MVILVRRKTVTEDIFSIISNSWTTVEYKTTTTSSKFVCLGLKNKIKKKKF